MDYLFLIQYHSVKIFMKYTTFFLILMFPKLFFLDYSFFFHYFFAK